MKASGLAKALDERVGGGAWLNKAMRKVFPDHWTFLLGEIALYAFVIVLLTGVFLTFFFKPSMTEVVYDGSYVPLRGVAMSEAYASSLEISFDVRGGLLMRQLHHWSTLVFLAAICVHMLRNFFTGAFRKPRDLNWLIGVLLFTLVLLNGLFGYSLPDDALSGAGLRILHAVILSIPLVGTHTAMFLFGGEYPSDDIISRLFSIHTLLIPGLLLALIPLHAVVLTWRQTHTQFRAKGLSNRVVRGRRSSPPSWRRRRRSSCSRSRSSPCWPRCSRSTPSGCTALPVPAWSVQARSPTGTWASWRARCASCPAGR
ncbi:cytochrome b [Nonomuraea recticatena]|uniref:cytochrome b n=1 Tax=Nonomuraea recticatena TaxID=46178 RepID=UPI0036218AE3